MLNMTKKEVADPVLRSKVDVVGPKPDDLDAWESAPDKDAPMIVILNPKSSFKSLLFNTFLSVLADRVARGMSVPLHLWEVETSSRIGPLYKNNFRSDLLPEKAKKTSPQFEYVDSENGFDLFLSRFISVAQASPCAIEFGSNYSGQFWDDYNKSQKGGQLDAEFGPPSRFIFLVPVTGEQDVVEGAISMLHRIGRSMQGARVLVFEADFKGPISDVAPDFLDGYQKRLAAIPNRQMIRVPSLPIKLPGGTTGSRIDIMRKNPAKYCGADGAVEKLSDRVQRRTLSSDERHQMLRATKKVPLMENWLDEMWKVGENIADNWDDACRDAGMRRNDHKLTVTPDV
jgi:hypothetical protein